MAEKKAAERVLCATGDPWAALRELGIARPSTKRGGKKDGRRGRSEQELERIGQWYDNMREPFAPGPWSSPNASLEHCLRAAAERMPLPPESYFHADCDAPMDHTARVRNLARIKGVTEKRMLAILRQEDRRRARNGERPLLGMPARRLR